MFLLTQICYQKQKKSAVSSVIAAVLVFFIPTFVDVIVKFVSPEGDYSTCISDISIETINTAHYKIEDDLVSKAEETLDVNNYYFALNYLINITDENKRTEYTNRLDSIKSLIDDLNKKIDSNYSKINYSNFKWWIYKNESGPASKYYSKILPHLIWAPENTEDLNGISLPLIVWLHGSGALSYQPNMSIQNYAKTEFPKIVSDWSKTGLKPIPAIIVAPQAAGQWASEPDTRDVKMESIKALIEYTKEKYNINPNSIVLMGHSIGGNGVVHTSYEMQKKYRRDYFSKLVIFSGTGMDQLKYPKNDLESGLKYFSSKEIKGYSENEKSKPFFEWIGKPNNFRLISGTSHTELPRVAMSLDENNDKVSDIVYWLFGENANITISEESSNKDNEGELPGGTKASIPPGERPIKDSINITSLNSSIASAAKSSGLYTRGAVVNVAKTLINTLKSNNYYIPYQLGGMYHRDNAWGVNPSWGTLITHDNKQVLSGLDCRNFVIWTFKQAGLSLKRGLVYCGEGSLDGDCASKTSVSHKYNDISQGRPGDVIDHQKHIMLIVSNNGSSYTVAESNGVGYVRLQEYTYSDLKNAGYNAYNMDAVYNNTAMVCSLQSSDRPYSGSCHIPKSEFPSYY